MNNNINVTLSHHLWVAVQVPQKPFDLSLLGVLSMPPTENLALKAARWEVLEELHRRNLLEVAVSMEALQQVLIYQQLIVIVEVMY